MLEGVSFLLAFSAGMLSFLSPCFLPLVPAYLIYLSGSSKGTVSFPRTLAFICGFSLVFILLGMSAGFLGQLLLQHQILLRQVSGIIIILFGLHLLGILEMRILYREKRWLERVEGKGWLGAFLLGIAFSFGWTPCLGPVLSSILLLASTAKTVGAGMILLSIYSLGLALPFILTAVFWQYFLHFLPQSQKYFNFFSKLSGILLLILGVMVFTNFFSRLSSLFPYFNL